jgi:hypothetical protein
MEPGAFILVFWLTASSPIVVDNIATKKDCIALGETMGADVKLSSFNCYGYRIQSEPLDRPVGYRRAKR